MTVLSQLLTPKAARSSIAPRSRRIRAGPAQHRQQSEAGRRSGRRCTRSRRSPRSARRCSQSATIAAAGRTAPAIRVQDVQPPARLPESEAEQRLQHDDHRHEDEPHLHERRDVVAAAPQRLRDGIPRPAPRSASRRAAPAARRRGSPRGRPPIARSRAIQFDNPRSSSPGASASTVRIAASSPRPSAPRTRAMIGPVISPVASRTTLTLVRPATTLREIPVRGPRRSPVHADRAILAQDAPVGLGDGATATRTHGSRAGCWPRSCSGSGARRRTPSDCPPADFDDGLVEIAERVRPYTMTSPDRLAGLVEGVEHILRHELPGAIVECGVWKGGSMMAAALTLLAHGVTDRDLYLCDTFAGHDRADGRGHRQRRRRRGRRPTPARRGDRCSARTAATGLSRASRRCVATSARRAIRASACTSSRARSRTRSRRSAPREIAAPAPRHRLVRVDRARARASLPAPVSRRHPHRRRLRTLVGLAQGRRRVLRAAAAVPAPAGLHRPPRRQAVTMALHDVRDRPGSRGWRCARGSTAAARAVRRGAAPRAATAGGPLARLASRRGRGAAARGSRGCAAAAGMLVDVRDYAQRSTFLYGVYEEDVTRLMHRIAPRLDRARRRRERRLLHVGGRRCRRSPDARSWRSSPARAARSARADDAANPARARHGRAGRVWRAAGGDRAAPQLRPAQQRAVLHARRASRTHSRDRPSRSLRLDEFCAPARSCPTS